MDNQYAEQHQAAICEAATLLRAQGKVNQSQGQRKAQGKPVDARKQISAVTCTVRAQRKDPECGG